MNLKILLPFRVYLEKAGVLRINVETATGSFGLLPQRLDCLATLVPGILMYETATEGETFIAVDEGVMVKTGSEVLVSVRRAMTGQDLAALRESVELEYATLDENERRAREVMAKLETGFLRRLATFQHE